MKERTAHPHIHVEKDKVTCTDMSDTEIAENVDGVVGVEEGILLRNIRNNTNAVFTEGAIFLGC